MAYLAPDFRHDVFVSYAHGDIDGAGTSLLKGWSLAFKLGLEAELRHSLSSPGLSIFVDENKQHDQGLDGSNPLTRQLQEAASGAALLLILMSPPYLRSDWCRDERSWWFKQTKAQAFPEVGSRHFVARIGPVNDDSWPKELCDEGGHPPLGFWFHERPGDEFFTRPFAWPKPAPDTAGEFRDALVDLAGQMAARMRKLNEALLRTRQAAADRAKLRADGGQLIYLHGRARDKARWEAAYDELDSAGYAVLPHAPQTEFDDPRLANDAEKEIIRTLSRCDGLLLVPSDDPWSLNADLAVVGRQWRNSARAQSRKLLPCAVVDRGLTLDAKPRLRRTARTLGIDWIDAAITGWIGELRVWLGAAGASQSGAA